MADFPMVRGKSYDFSAIETSIPLAGILREVQEINYSDNVERGELRAGVPWVIATTRGEYSAECNLVMSKQAHVWLVTKVEELSSGAGIYDYEFPMTVVYGRTGMPTIRDELKKCSLIGGEASNAQGSDPSMVSVPIHLCAIYWNGSKPFGDMAF